MDLYNDDQIEKLIRKASERLEISTNNIREALAELVDKLEKYRIEKLEKKVIETIQKKTLPQGRKKVAISYLKSPDLLKRTNEDIGIAGVIGEETNRLLMYLVFTSRLMHSPLHIISLGASGSGKTYLQEKLAELIPDDHKLEITALSENALYYFDRTELKHKLIVIEDLDGADSDKALLAIRELMSKKIISKTIPIKDSKGNLKTITIKVEGPICLAGTTTQEGLYEDNANRSLLIYRDQSRKHYEAIMDYQRKLSAGVINKEEENRVKEKFKDIQRVLKPIAVSKKSICHKT